VSDKDRLSFFIEIGLRLHLKILVQSRKVGSIASLCVRIETG
jgi:hypothetical protein